jgi:hypothetical protein
VIEGVLKLSTGTEDGREQIVGVVYPSDFIGRPFGGTTNHGVTALTDARVCVFSRVDFDGFARSIPISNTSCCNARWANWTARGAGCCCWAASRRARRWRAS